MATHTYARVQRVVPALNSSRALDVDTTGTVRKAGCHRSGFFFCTDASVAAGLYVIRLGLPSALNASIRRRDPA